MFLIFFTIEGIIVKNINLFHTPVIPRAFQTHHYKSDRGLLEYMHFLSPIQHLDEILRKGNKFPISQKNGEQIITDLSSGFYNVARKDGSHYIDHLIETLFNTQEYDTTFDTVSLQIALLHDSIEDTDETFESLQEKYGDMVALGVDILSKKPFWEYIPSYDIQTSRWTDEMREFSTLKENIEKIIGKKIDHDFKFSDHSRIPEDLKNKWEIYETTYKQVRNQEYFSKFQDLSSLQEHVRNEVTLKWITLSEEEIRILAHKIAIIKLSDRKHNIETLPEGKRRGKIQETLQYLAGIGREVGKGLWNKISHEMLMYAVKSTQEKTLSATSS